MKFVYSDGGRSKYFKADNVGDCVCRAICNAGGYDYKEIYDALKAAAKSEKTEKQNGKRSSVRDGVYKGTRKKFLEELGWTWHPTMRIGSGCTVHLREDELPSGNLIVSVSGHLTCVKDGVLYDTYDCSRDGTRCVYGYYTKEDDKEPDLSRLNITWEQVAHKGGYMNPMLPTYECVVGYDRSGAEWRCRAEFRPEKRQFMVWFDRMTFNEEADDGSPFHRTSVIYADHYWAAHRERYHTQYCEYQNIFDVVKEFAARKRLNIA